MEGVRNRHELRVIGMSRSGNHAVLEWILAQAPGRTCFLNCTEGKHNPFASARELEEGRPYRVNFGDFDPVQERQGRLTLKDWLVFSHEDSFLSNACSRIYDQHHDDWVGPSAHRQDVLILRDPFNLFASRWRSAKPRISDATAVQMWKQHARALLNPAKGLRHDPVVVSFNRWFLDGAYRERIAARLDLPFTDAGRERVAHCHGGSSFDGLNYDGRAQHMKVLHRWRAYAREPTYRSLFDERMLDLVERTGVAQAMTGLHAWLNEPVSLPVG